MFESHILQCLLLLVYISLSVGQSDFNSFVVPATEYSSPDSTCPPSDTIQEDRRRIRDSIRDYYNTLARPCSCGGPGWTRIAYLNMADPNTSCPSNLNHITTPVRGCGRSATAGLNTCDSVINPVNDVLTQLYVVES